MIGSGPHIYTRDAFKKFILSKLGYPVVNVEVTDEQLEYIINETLAEFIPYSDDGLEMRYRVIDLTCGQLDYLMPYNVYSVVSVYQTNYLDYTPSSSDLFNVNQHLANDILKGGMGKMDLLTLELVQEQIASMGVIFGKRITFDYNAITKILHFFADPTTDAGIQDSVLTGKIMRVFLEYYRCMDLGDSTNGYTSNIFDVKWVQHYAVALARMQWGDNLLKHAGTPLPNGMTVNAEKILERGEKERDKLIESLKEEWQQPVDFFIG